MSAGSGTASLGPVGMVGVKGPMGMLGTVGLDGQISNGGELSIGIIATGEPGIVGPGGSGTYGIGFGWMTGVDGGGRSVRGIDPTIGMLRNPLGPVATHHNGFVWTSPTAPGTAETVTGTGGTMISGVSAGNNRFSDQVSRSTTFPGGGSGMSIVFGGGSVSLTGVCGAGEIRFPQRARA